MRGSTPGPGTNVKIGVFADGRIEANGSLVTIDELRTMLRDLAKGGGAVWYYREAASQEPHPNAMLVIEAVAENQLPISMSTKPDFSDFVDDQGRSRPRTGGP